MDTTAESSSASANLPIEDCVLTARQELTHLFLTEKSYFLRIAGSILRNTSDAEDALHTAFGSAWRVIDMFRGESSLKTWFVRIVQNAALGILRKRGNRVVSLDDDPEYLQAFELRTAAKVADPEQIVLRREQRGLLNEYIQELPEETRIIFTLHLAGECSIDTIARIRKKSRPSVVSHLQRGKATLRKRVMRLSARNAGVRRTALVH
ncbi:MAG TPA: sigma-70 family RNA polymerase sigma factor [Edaphobacter sp.]